MTPEDLKRAHALAVGLAGDAAGWISASKPTRVHAKSAPSGLVTDQDPAIERELRDRILNTFPGHRVVGEELGTGDGPRVTQAGQDVPTWYLDPIDGTSNFASGLPLCAVSIALVHQGRTCVGAVGDPWRAEVFSALSGAGALLNGRPLRAREVSGLAGELVLTEWVGNQPWPGMIPFFQAVAERNGVVRILGSTALSLVQTAAGRSCATVLGACDPIDDAAGVLIAQEAGASIVNDGAGILAVAPGAASALMSTLRVAGALDTMSRAVGG
ncbi:inositol monophosphatase family protein [Streptomyces shenzhenensis]